MIRTYPERQAPVHNVLAQTQGQAHDSLFGLFVPYRIVVQRAGYPRNRRIETVAMLRTHYLLQDDCHLFLVNHIAGSLHIRLAVLIVYRCIYPLDGITQHPVHGFLVFQIRNHIGRIDTGKRLVMRVFQQARRTDGDRRAHHIEEGQEVFHQPFRQAGTEEGIQDHLIGCITQGYLIQVVCIHELVEDVGTEHHRLRDGYRCVVKLLEFRMTLHHVVDEGQTAALASQRTFANAGKVRVAVETVALENRYHPPVLHLAVLHNGFEDHPSVLVHILYRVPRNLLQELCWREHGTRVQPTRNMVLLYMVQERFGRYVENDVLQLLQVTYACHLFLGMRIAEDEIPEPEVVRHNVAQVHIHLLGVLVYKAGCIPAHIVPVFHLGRLENQRYERVLLAYFRH